MANIPFKTITFPGLANKYVIPEIDNTLRVSGKAADAKKTGDDISGLKADLAEGLNLKGFVPSDTYSDINDVFEYGMFAVRDTALNLPEQKRGTLLVMPIGLMDASSGLYRYRKQQVYITGEAGGQNIYLRYMSNSSTWSPNWTKVIDNGIYTRLTNIDEKALISSGFTSATMEVGGINSSGGNSTNDKRIRTHGYISVIGYKSMHYSVNSGYRILAAFFSNNASNAHISPVTAWLEGSGVYIFPEGTKYIRIQYASLSDATALTVNNYNVADIKWGTALIDTHNDVARKTKWLAIGDSITYGIYSTGASTEVTDKHGWAQRLAGSMGYDLTTMASRGIGYTVTGVDPLNSSASRISLATLISRATALTNDFNLITVMLGINDYNTSGKLLTDIESSLSATIESLMSAFPLSRLVVITPLNCTKEGDTSTKYAYGATHSTNTWTLSDLVDSIKSVCGSYGVEVINATDGFLLNTQNITQLLPDGVHPSYYAHDLIAKTMSRYLMY